MGIIGKTQVKSGPNKSSGVPKIGDPRNERIDPGEQKVKKKHKIDGRELTIGENMGRRGHETHDGHPLRHSRKSGLYSR